MSYQHTDSSQINRITVIKRDLSGKETWRYTGKLLEHLGNRLVLEAYFDRQDSLFHGIPLHRGDRFIETYFTQRWYNIFEIHAREDDHLRGWYCNIGRPAVLEDEHKLSYIDLALDLLVFPDGQQLVLDEDEFATLDLTPYMQQQALEALHELRIAFAHKLPPSLLFGA